MIEPAAAALAAERATGAGLGPLLQMGGLISVGLRASFRISTRSYDAGVQLHGRAFEAIRDRHPELARETMAPLLSSTREFLERELAGPVHDAAEEPRTAAR